MKKKLLSLGLAIAMTVTASNIAFAEKTVIIDQDGTTIATTDGIIAGGEATGGGSTTVVDTDIMVVQLSTTAPDFTMDPQGILGASQGKSDGDSLAAADVTAAAGKIISNKVLFIKNKGAKPVNAEATFIPLKEGDKTVFTAQADVEADTNNNVAFEVIPSAIVKDAEDAALLNWDAAANTNAGGFGISTGTAPADDSTNKADLADTGKTFKYTLIGNATYGYKVSGSDIVYEAGVNKTAATKEQMVGFRVSGKVNTKADWSDYSGASPAEAVKLKVVYSVTRNTDGTAPTDSKFVSNAAPTAATATLTSGNYTISAPADIVITFNPNVSSGNLKTSGLLINGKDVTAEAVWGRGDLGSISGNTATIKPAALTRLGITPSAGTPIKITLTSESGATYDVNVTVVA